MNLLIYLGSCHGIAIERVVGRLKLTSTETTFKIISYLEIGLELKTKKGF